MNTAGGSVRFNPNLYANGKVCVVSRLQPPAVAGAVLSQRPLRHSYGCI
jgi:hypothetical protein